MEASILPKALRMIGLQYEPTKVNVSNHSEGDKSVARFNEAMKSLSMAISDPDHCKTLLSQNPYSADPIVKAHLALASLDQMIAYSDGWASKMSLIAMCSYSCALGLWIKACYLPLVVKLLLQLSSFRPHIRLVPKATANLVASFLLQTPLQVNTVSRLGNRHTGHIPLALSWTEIIRTRHTLRPQVPALIKTSDLEGLPTGLLEIAIETSAIRVREIGRIAKLSSILTFGINLNAILEMIIVV